MMIIEGPDACGKSTAAFALRRMLGNYSYRHHTKPPCDTFAYFTLFTADAHSRLIVDRLHWSAYCYDYTYREKPSLSPHEWRLMELQLLALGARVVLMWDDPENICERWDDSVQMWPKEKITKLMECYSALWWDADPDYCSHLPRTMHQLPMLLDSSGRAGSELYQLAAQAREDVDRVAGLLPPSQGMGCPEPEFLILGEQPGEAIPGGVVAPGLPLDRGKAAEWMWGAFDELGLEWWKGYYTNCSVFPSSRDFADYLNTKVTPKTVLCLGSVAGRMARQAIDNRFLRPDITVFQVDHPMYNRRFGHNQRDRWVGEISSVLSDWCKKG